ncbi:proline-rich protein 29 isoform X2 [Macrotis lagotis]|uniref:proline-rich protein 29 isoform X2 n=1 Tax=Macrotis lagotis TaxID=92651 RepID=UPI003D69A895
MAWRDGWSPAGPGAQVPAPPVTILQSLPQTWESPHQPGHMKEDLLSLMMLQNIQMHQLLMSRLTLGALDSKALPSFVDPGKVSMLSLQDEEEEEEEEEILVFHYHYLPWSAPAPVPLLPCPVSDSHQSWLPEVSEIRNLPQDSQITPSARRGVPPPPPPSATGTVGADIPPASDYYDVAEEQL